MIVAEVKPIMAVWLRPTDVGTFIGRKRTATYEFLKDFREFVESHPSHFVPVKPMLEMEGESYLYNLYAIAYYLENKLLLDGGNRTIRFRDDLERLKEAY